MSMPKTLSVCLGLLAAAAASSALAGDWKLCELQVQLREQQTNPAELQTRVLAASTPNQAECPQPGSALSFRPETVDYQNELPRAQWPQPNQTVTVHYRYLDGQCKDRGPCRIQHYSPVLH